VTGSQRAADLLALLVETFEHTITVGLYAPDLQPTAEQVRFFLLHRLGHEPVEVLRAMYFASNGALLHERECARGDSASCLPAPREIVRTALSLGANAVVLAHNHPSGSPKPSAHDVRFSASVANALALVDAALIDHLIIAAGQVTSMRQLGLLPEPVVK
jgi:DNA repair protein RadC